MLQQTRMEVVLPYFHRFLDRFPSIPALASASDDEVVAAWSGLGYYRRARMLRDGAAVVVQRFNGEIPKHIDDLLTIPGIGRYTAGAIASIAFGQRAAIVDGNVARVTARLFGSDGDSWSRATALVEGCHSPRDFNQGLMELGALVCTPRNPACPACPVRTQCVAAATGRAEELPAPKPKKAPRELSIDLYLIADRRGHVLMRREAGPLMNAMYHLPHGDTSLLTGRPLETTARKLVGAFKHTVTTRKIAFAVFSAELSSRIADSVDEYEWIDPALMREVPHPSYVRKALEMWRDSGALHVRRTKRL